MVPREYGDDRLGKKLEQFKLLRTIRRKAYNGNITASVIETHQRFGDMKFVKLKVNTRTPSFECPNERCRELGRAVVEESHSEHGWNVLDEFEDAIAKHIDAAEQSTCLAYGKLARGRQSHAFWAAHQQPRTQVFLETADKDAERRLRNVQALCTASERALLADCDQEAKRSQVDVAIHTKILVEACWLRSTPLRGSGSGANRGVRPCLAKLGTVFGRARLYSA